MSHIGLLMTGVLTTGQPSPPQLPEQPLVQPDNPVQQSTQEQLTTVFRATEITPPEFIHLDGSLQVARSAIRIEQQNILKKFTEKILSTQSQFSQTLGKETAVENSPKQGGIEVVADVSSLVRQQLAVTGFSDKQGSNELIIARSPKPKPKFTSQNLPSLGFGSSGVSVKVLQRLLLTNGYAVRVDGVFGALTESAVKAFQNRRNLLADGVVGPRTWRELTK